MKVEKTPLDGVLLIEPPTNFEDFRGEYIEIYNERLYKAAGISFDFVQDDISVSSRHVLRGIHGDGTTAKLVSCLLGKFYLVVVNMDPTSSQYKKWTSFTLSDKNRRQVLIPPKFGNGHLVLSETAIFHYKQTTEYNRSGQFTVLWNDPEISIWWPNITPIISRRDLGLD
ncbi:dTDP-4-dehydrorhamnose 3,5-epimerase [Ferrovibrio terrae]|uniref:dTDP-4-dehydrorhamnose 3,5-epimerase family protein n=1 Tax=Ferrovibrio terrae TaxID=2594003 RepID=UPI003137ACEF